MNHSSRFLKRPSFSGFTLLEIMLVVVIIALLAGSAIFMMGGNLTIAQETKAQGDIQALSTQLKLYQARNGFFPSTEQGLQALMVRPSSEPKPTQWTQLMEKLPRDPWQMEYVYLSPGKHNPNSFDLYSPGKDRKPDTADDIGNWDAK